MISFKTEHLSLKIHLPLIFPSHFPSFSLYFPLIYHHFPPHHTLSLIFPSHFPSSTPIHHFPLKSHLPSYPTRISPHPSSIHHISHHLPSLHTHFPLIFSHFLIYPHFTLTSSYSPHLPSLHTHFPLTFPSHFSSTLSTPSLSLQITPSLIFPSHFPSNTLNTPSLPLKAHLLLTPPLHTTPHFLTTQPTLTQPAHLSPHLRPIKRGGLHSV